MSYYQEPATSRWSRSEWAACFALFVAALTVRLVGTALFEGLSAPPNADAFYDGVEFDAIARNLVRNGEFAIEEGHPTSWRAPGLPLVLAVVYWIGGTSNYAVAHVFLGIVGALIVFPTFALARRFAGTTVAVLAAGAVAVLPTLAYYSVHFASEPLHTVALCYSTALLVQANEHRSSRLALAAGLALGVATLARPVAVYFIPFFIVALLLISGLRPAARLATAIALGAAMVVLPWTARNFSVHGRWLLVASNGGSTFWGSNNDVVARDARMRGEWISTLSLRPDTSSIDQLPNEVDRDRAEFDEGARWIRAHPLEAARLAWWKLLKFWTPFPTTSNRAFAIIGGISYLLWLPLAIVGASLALRGGGRRRSISIVMLAPVFGSMAAAAVFYGSPRFRSPIEPLLLVWACYAIWRVVEPRLARRAGIRQSSVYQQSAVDSR